MNHSSHAGRACILLTLMCCLVGALAQPQTPENHVVAEPEFADVFFRLDANGGLIALERQTVVFKGQAGGFIVMNMKSSSEIPGGHSPIRFRADEKLDFLVRSAIAGSVADPNTLYALRKLDKQKKKREIVMMTGHASVAGASIKTNLTQGAFPIVFTRYGKSSIKISAGSLPPGEYALGRANYPQTVFCFGVD
jgi:hypothetical protein